MNKLKKTPKAILAILIQCLLMPIESKAQLHKNGYDRNTDSISITHLFKASDLKFKSLYIKKSTNLGDIKYNADERDGRYLRILIISDKEFDEVLKIFMNSNNILLDSQSLDHPRKYSEGPFGLIETHLNYQGITRRDFMQPDEVAITYFSSLISNTNNTKYKISNKCRLNLTEYFLDMSFFLESIQIRALKQK